MECTYLELNKQKAFLLCAGADEFLTDHFDRMLYYSPENHTRMDVHLKTSTNYKQIDIASLKSVHMTFGNSNCTRLAKLWKI